MDNINSDSTYLREIINLMPGNVYWLSRDGITLGCNDNLLKVHGLSTHKNYVGKHYSQFFEPEDFAAIQKTNEEVMRSDKTMILEELAKRDGKTYLTHKVPLHDADGNVIGLLGISFDITAKKRLEKNIHKAKVKAKLQEEKIKAMQTLSASIAHELRTPLRAIKNNTAIEKYLAILIDGYQQARAAKLPVRNIAPLQFEAIQEAITAIQQETDYANNFINMLIVNIKEFDRPEQDFKTHSISRCLEEALARYPFLPPEQKELVHLNTKAEFSFYGSSQLVIHILFNLLKNALYHIEKAKKGDITITLKKTKNFNRLVFRDTGAGIRKELLPHIFNYFFTTTNVGTGIGLAFCKMAMQNMGGNIEVSSEEGLFTEFTLTFNQVNV